MTKPILGYWDIHGLGQPIRLLLAHCGVDYEDKHENRDEWYSTKQTRGFEFPNLPYYIEGDLHLVQSQAILRHVARKHNLLGSTPELQAKADMYFGVIEDWRSKWTGMCYNSEFHSLKESYLTSYLPNILEQIEKCLQGKKYFLGSELSFVDFWAYEVIIQNGTFLPTIFEGRPNLEAFYKNFKTLKGIKETEARTAKLVFNGKSAKFNEVAAI